MGLFDSLFGGRTAADRPSSVTFVMDGAGHRYEDGNVGLLPTTLTIGPDTRRVAVIGLNGSGKTTLLKLLDGALTASVGTVAVMAHRGDETGDDATDDNETDAAASNKAAHDGDVLNPAIKRDLKRIEDLVGRVRREEIPDSYYRAKDIREAIDLPLKKHKVPESERQQIIGDLFAHFDLTSVAREPASALDSEKRHLLAIASALSFSPAAIVADEPTKGLDEIGSAHVARALFSYDRQVVFATHDIDLIQRPEYAIDRTLVLDDHQLVFDGSPADAAAFYTDLIRKKYEAAKASRQ
ncbi:MULTISPECIES: energy-coupling factor ABC transporter ATP-binding protein [Bifidobacterium]|uniref:ATP-binding cassette domain-containing protein n=1 Tax=Bifidobacterium TaxID=1678 RepID=UPI001BDDC252|nr:MULTISPECIES: energy-coupling factor ABC transporter ATP-binding protein [Bifidobacterium]MBT1162913.1 energy-coupling factor ABC transporter ATP-binding protein [Bifidobacterium sp. SO1]MBW3077900.1 energy-coupling factor ABC transporter ATP-binding protein [Bifidobacterium simiiventris]